VIEVLVLIGLFFLSVGTIGLLRLPDVFNRMHATSKATTLGTGFVIFAGAIKFYPDGVWMSAIVTLVFLFMTAPTGAHMIARAADRNS
jgi:multicomponent Na+:H+ antiporter subunit G